MSKSKYDVVVVGAGPAGCFFSFLMATAGFKTALLEKRKRSAIGHNWTDDVETTVFDQVGLPVPPIEDWTHSPAPTTIVAPDDSFRRDFGQPEIVPLDMKIFVDKLADRAEKAGVVFIDSVEIDDLVFGADGPRELKYTRNGEADSISAELFVDASGIAGALRNMPGFSGMHADRLEDSNTCTAYRGSIKVDKKKLKKWAKKKNYQSHINYGVLASRGTFAVENILLDLDKGELDILIGFMKEHGNAGEEVRDYLEREGFGEEKIRGGGAMIPIDRQLDRLVGDRFMIIGDAACQVISGIGSGVASGLIAANLASETAKRALRKGKTDAADLWSYCSRYHRGRGAMMAYFKGVQLVSGTLSPEDTNWLIESGAMISDDFKAANNVRLVNPLKGIISRTRAVSKRPGLAARFLARSAVIALIPIHYKRFPKTLDEYQLEKWAKTRDKIFRLIGPG